MKNVVKAAVVAGIFGVSAFFTVSATPLDITLTGTAPLHQWGGGADIYGQDFQYKDLVVNESYSGPSQLNLAGVNSIQVTWQAPAGYMYVVDPPPADFQNQSLEFNMSLIFGTVGQASSLGSVTSQNMFMNLVYGNPGLTGGVAINNQGPPNTTPALSVSATTYMGPGSSAFAFTSLTIDATFSGTGVSQLLNPNEALDDGPSQFFAAFFGLSTIYGTYSGAPDPGQLFTLEPLSSGSVPDNASTLTLAGMSILGLVVCGRKFGMKEAAV